MMHRPETSDVTAVVSLVAAITSQQEQISWVLGVVATTVAIVAGVVTIWQKLRRGSRKDD